MTILKDFLLQYNFDIEQLMVLFFESGDACEASITHSAAFILLMCNSDKKTIWDFVRDEGIDIDKDTEYTDYQKTMVKASLLLAWEKLERDRPEICLDIHTKYFKP